MITNCMNVVYKQHIGYKRILYIKLIIECLFVLQMNDVMLYTYPQQDGKYRLKNTLTLSGMKVRLI